MALARFGSFRASTSVALLLALAVIGVFAYNRYMLYLERRKFQKEYGCKPLPPHSYTHTVLGLNTVRERIKAAKDNRLLDFSVNKFKRNGNTWGMTVGFDRTVIMTIEPENVKTILSIRFKEFGLGNREYTLGLLLGKGIFTTDGELWAHSRAMIRPNFTRDQVADLAAFERHIQTLFKILPVDGSTVDLQELFFKMTIDSATEFLFGESTHTLKATLSNSGGSASDFAIAFNTAQTYCAERGRTGLGILRWMSSDAAGPDAIRICHAFVDQFVNQAIRYREKTDLEGQKATDKDSKYLFLHELAKATTDKRRLRDELLNVLLAGRDTTASLLSNMWFMISKRPDIMAKLRAEVDTLQGRLPTYEQVRNMKYLKWCMNESLRLHPVVPANSRLANTDTVLPVGGGPEGKDPLFVRKGTIVSYWTYAMHRRQDFYGPDADEFKPERWETLRPGWEYLPFNGGPRICLGQQYALTEAGYVSIRLLQQYDVESRDMGRWVEGLTLTVCSKNGTRVGLTPRVKV